MLARTVYVSGEGGGDWSALLAAVLIVSAVIVFPVVVGLSMRLWDRYADRRRERSLA